MNCVVCGNVIPLHVFHSLMYVVVFIVLQDELVLVLKKKLEVLKQDQEFRDQEIEDNEVTGANVSSCLAPVIRMKNLRQYHGIHS